MACNLSSSSTSFYSRLDQFKTMLFSCEIFNTHFYNIEGVKVYDSAGPITSGKGIKIPLAGLPSINVNSESIMRLGMAPSGSRCWMLGLRNFSEIETEDGPLNGYEIGCKNARYIHSHHGPNRVFLYLNAAGDLCLHLQQVFLRGGDIKNYPLAFGKVAFALLAIEAHKLGVQEISLVAGGGNGINGLPWDKKQKMRGYSFWPSVGFDAELSHDLIVSLSGYPCAGCASMSQHGRVLDLYQHDRDRWISSGDGGFMTFDLAPNSASWDMLLSLGQRL